MQEITCNSPDCDETLRMDKYGRGEGILRGGGFYCDYDCYHNWQQDEIKRITNEMKSD